MKTFVIKACPRYERLLLTRLKREKEIHTYDETVQDVKDTGKEFSEWFWKQLKLIYGRVDHEQKKT